MDLELLPLGTNGFYPAFGRQTMCFLVKANERCLLLDAGSGVGRIFAETQTSARGSLAANWLSEVEALDVVLTHYHLDHVVGLASMSHAWRKPLRIWAPERPLVDASPQEALGRLLSPPLFPARLDEFLCKPEVHAYSGATLDLGHLELAVRRQKHPGGSAGLRLGDQLAYITDTAADEETIDFVHSVDWLLHEMWVSDAEGSESPRVLTGHSSVSQVADIAVRARVGVVAPVHHQPKRSEDDVGELVSALAGRVAALSREAGADAQHTSPRVVRLEEGRSYSLGLS